MIQTVFKICQNLRKYLKNTFLGTTTSLFYGAISKAKVITSLLHVKNNYVDKVLRRRSGKSDYVLT